jgi:hypothetical protein
MNEWSMTTQTSPSASALRQEQLRQAEELLFSGPQKAGFARDLFFGRFRATSILPYPLLSPDERRLGDEAVAAVREFCRTRLDPARIDRETDIPPEVIRGLGELGVLGMTVGREHGGRGLLIHIYCSVM